MSDEDRKAWKAKITGTRSGRRQVEIRVSRGAEALILVSKDGEVHVPGRRGHEKANVRISLNGGLCLSFGDLAELNLAIAEAFIALESE